MKMEHIGMLIVTVAIVVNIAAHVVPVMFESFVEETQENIRIWSEDDLEANKISSSGNIAEYSMMESVSAGTKSPFYYGSMPLKSKMIVKVMGSADRSLKITHELDSRFTNYFIYNNSALKINGTAEGAVTIDKFANNKVVAEARFLRYIEGSEIEIEEFHYGPNGALIFKCKSHIDSTGIKVNQTEEIGKKKSDYYFFYPANMRGGML